MYSFRHKNGVLTNLVDTKIHDILTQYWLILQENPRWGIFNREPVQTSREQAGTGPSIGDF